MSTVLARAILEDEALEVRTELRLDSIVLKGFDAEYDSGWAVITWVPRLRVGRRAISGLDIEIKAIHVYAEGENGELELRYPEPAQDVPDDPREIVMTMGRPWRAEVYLSEPLPTCPYELEVDNDRLTMTVNF